MAMQQRVLSGIQPSGDLHLGNYVGALKQWVAMQNTYESIFCLVDLHAITVPQDPLELHNATRKAAALLFAAGIDPAKSTLFVQSHVAAHTEMAWVLNCLTPIGWLQRMTQFKDKSGKKDAEQISTGLFDYPVLMAADILLYQTDLVPVGEDQAQHVELARDIAERFNTKFGATFKIPKAFIPPVGARVMSLKDPSKKMSKSDDDVNGAVLLTDTPEVIAKKIAGATTDSGSAICFDQTRPGIYNLLVLYEVFSGKSRVAIEAEFAGQGYAVFKKALAELVVASLTPLQKKYHAFMQDPAELDRMLVQGAGKIRPMAEAMMKKVKEKVGLG